MGTAVSIQSKLFTGVGIDENHHGRKCSDTRTSTNIQSALSTQRDDILPANELNNWVTTPYIAPSPLNDFVKTCFSQECHVSSLRVLLQRSDFLLAFVNYCSYNFDCRSQLSNSDIRIIKVIMNRRQ